MPVLQGTKHSGDYAAGIFPTFFKHLGFLLPALTEFLTDIVTQHVKSCHAEFLSGFIQLALHADFPVFLTLIADGRERLLVEVILLAKRADPLLRDCPHPFAGDRKGLYRLLRLFRAF